MLIRVIARVLELDEDLILQNIEPKRVFVWAVKYIRYDTIETFQALDKNKTVLFLYEGEPIIVKENVDKFYDRLADKIKEDEVKSQTKEFITFEQESDQDEEEED